MGSSGPHTWTWRGALALKDDGRIRGAAWSNQHKE
jgi:hypothetical protein